MRARRRLEQIVRRRDPQGIAAKYLRAVGDPAYETAFSKMLADPMMGHLKFSVAEVEAVRRVGAVEAERAFATTTTGIPMTSGSPPTASA